MTWLYRPIVAFAVSALAVIVVVGLWHKHEVASFREILSRMVVGVIQEHAIFPTIASTMAFPELINVINVPKYQPSALSSANHRLYILSGESGSQGVGYMAIGHQKSSNGIYDSLRIVWDCRESFRWQDVLSVNTSRCDSGRRFPTVLYTQMNPVPSSFLLKMEPWGQVRHCDIGPLNHLLVDRLLSVVINLRNEDTSLDGSKQGERKSVIRELLLRCEIVFRVVSNLPLQLKILFFVGIILLGGFIEVIGLNYFDSNRLLGASLVCCGGGIMLLAFGWAAFGNPVLFFSYGVEILGKLFTSWGGAFHRVGVQALHV